MTSNKASARTLKKTLPDKIKVKIVVEVDRILYERIIESAKEQGLPGTIEDVLRTNTELWFESWHNILYQVDNQQTVLAPRLSHGIVGPDGKVIGNE